MQRRHFRASELCTAGRRAHASTYKMHQHGEKTGQCFRGKCCLADYWLGHLHRAKWRLNSSTLATAASPRVVVPLCACISSARYLPTTQPCKQFLPHAQSGHPATHSSCDQACARQAVGSMRTPVTQPCGQLLLITAALKCTLPPESMQAATTLVACIGWASWLPPICNHLPTTCIPPHAKTTKPPNRRVRKHASMHTTTPACATHCILSMTLAGRMNLKTMQHDASKHPCCSAPRTCCQSVANCAHLVHSPPHHTAH